MFDMTMRHDGELDGSLLLAVHPDLVARARAIVAALDKRFPNGWSAAHLRMGNDFRSAFPSTDYTDMLDWVRSNRRPVYCATDVNLTTIDGCVQGFESPTDLVVEQLVCAAALSFRGTSMSTMSDGVLRLRALRPTWAAMRGPKSNRPKVGRCGKAWCSGTQSESPWQALPVRTPECANPLLSRPAEPQGVYL